jgi:hypothetical protein
MGLVSRLDLASTLNVAAICAALALVGAIVVGVI